MSASTIEEASILTGRQLMLFVVIGLHVLAIGALMKMNIEVGGDPPPGFKPLTSVTPVEPVPPEPRPRLVPTEGVVTTHWPDSPVPVIGREETVRSLSNDAPVSPPGGDIVDGTPGDQAVIPSTALISRATRSPDDYYPAVSLQLQEEGVTTVRVCVGPSGRPEGRPSVLRGSGSRRLDDAAVKWAGEALAFTPATRNGAAITACTEYRVRFTLR